MLAGQDKGPDEIRKPGGRKCKVWDCDSRSEALAVCPSTSKMFNPRRPPLTRIRQKMAPARLQYTPEREGGRPYRQAIFCLEPWTFGPPPSNLTDCGDWPLTGTLPLDQYWVNFLGIDRLPHTPASRSSLGIRVFSLASSFLHLSHIKLFISFFKLQLLH